MNNNLKSLISFIKEKGFNALTDEFGIIVKERDGLVLLDYDQINSPKTHPFVILCRGIVLDKETLEVKVRPFDRFFNYGEAFTPKLLEEAITNKSRIEYYPKVDGSLIRIAYYNSQWTISTRGTIVADNQTTYGSTFQDLVLKALDLKSLEEFQNKCNSSLNSDNTYLFELTSIENRIVTRYTGYTLHHLATRNTKTGKYLTESTKTSVLNLGAIEYRGTPFKSIEDLQNQMKEFKNLEEGFVIYIDGVPQIKLKSIAYLEIHRHRGNGVMSPKGIINLVLAQEHEEYLAYFPEEQSLFDPYIAAYNDLFIQLEFVWNNIVSGIQDQKQFALSVKNYPFSSLLFTKKRNPSSSFKEYLNKQSEKYQHALLDALVK